MPQGTATLNFGAFPGASDASVAVTGQGAILAASLVEAWLRPETTADHSADEHMLETIKVFAANIVAGTGFTIYGFNTSQLNEPVNVFREAGRIALAAGPGRQDKQTARTKGGVGTRLNGAWSCAWAWN